MIDKQTQVRTADQRFVEIDTTERVVKRLMTWAKAFAFFVGIPLAIILLGIAFYAGKSFKDLHDIAGSARESIQPLLDKARSDSDAAKLTAAEGCCKPPPQ